MSAASIVRFGWVMEAADILYGVTMGGDGVSQIVSRRLPREEPAVSAA